MRASNKELERFNRVAVGRELRVIELKKEVKELHRKAGEPTQYRVDFEEGTDHLLPSGDHSLTKEGN